mgnify:CR=1 FL=1
MALKHTRLKGITHIGKDNITQNLKYGIIDFFRWGMLCIGGYQNIGRNPATSGVFGGDRAQLRPVTDPYYTDGTVWEGFRSDWVWETGVPTDNVSSTPIRVSGVYVDGTFQSVSHVDYPRGRVVLNSAIATTSTVTCNFSHRYASFIPSDTPWFRELLFDSYRVERDFINTGSGSYSQLSETRRTLPFVAVEVVPRRDFEGYQLGGGQWLKQDVLFHIVAEKEFDRDQLVDVISLQNDKSIFLSDRNLMYSSSSFPIDLDYRGYPTASAIMYPEVISPTGVNLSGRNHGGFRYKKARFMDSTVQSMGQIHPKLFGAVVRSKVEVVMGEI